jgi:hypothetical protein
LGHASAKSQQFHQRDGTNQLEEEERITTNNTYIRLAQEVDVNFTTILLDNVGNNNK